MIGMSDLEKKIFWIGFVFGGIAEGLVWSLAIYFSTRM